MVGSFSEGLARFQADDKKWGFIDKSGRIAIRAKFDAAYDFQDGLAPVTVDEKFGYIDASGHYVWEPSR